MQITNYLPIKQSTLVTVTRNHKFGEDPKSPKGYQHGPMTLKQVLVADLLSSSSGTMSAAMYVADGEDYAGSPCVRRDGVWCAAVTEDVEF